MKRIVDLLGALLTAAVLCMMPARADVIGGPLVVMGTLGFVLVVAVIAVAASLLIRAIGRHRAKREADRTERDEKR